MPLWTEFGPPDGTDETEVIMSVDEYETIRLIDLEGLTQEQCAQQMEVARTTTQAVYAMARKKLAECIVYGRVLNIVGGDVRFCEGHDRSCGGHRGCGKRRCQRQEQMEENNEVK